MLHLLITGSGDYFETVFHPMDNERQGHGDSQIHTCRFHFAGCGAVFHSRGFPPQRLFS